MKTKTADLSAWQHDHVFAEDNLAAEKSTRTVAWITMVMMVVEIAAGYWFNSMALLADGWHMSSHTLAIGLSAFAYACARKYARDPRFAFGTWKIEILAGYSSAMFLVAIAGLMIYSSIERILSPTAIHYQEATFVAVLGLVVNLVCAFILGGVHHGHDHGHGHGHGHVEARSNPDSHGHDHDHAHSHSHAHQVHADVRTHAHHDQDNGHAHHNHDDGHSHAHHAAPARAADSAKHHDLNLKSAYVHVIADAATSVLAIIALICGWVFGWSWMDPVMGIIGAVMVAIWAKNLMVETGKVLLDREMDHPVVDEIREVVEVGPDADRTRIVDLHVWRVGKQSYSCALSLMTADRNLTPDIVRQRIAEHEEVVHATIEIRHYPLA